MQMKFSLKLNLLWYSSYLMLLKPEIHLPQYIEHLASTKNANVVGSSLALFIPTSEFYI